MTGTPVDLALFPHPHFPSPSLVLFPFLFFYGSSV